MQARYAGQRVDTVLRDVLEAEAPLHAPGEDASPLQVEVGAWEILVTAGAEAPAVRPATPNAAASSAQDALLPAVGLDIDGILELFDAWMRLDVGDGNASPLTLAAYRGDVKQHLIWLAERGLTPAAVTTFGLKDYRAHLVERHQVSTVGRKLASIRRFYQMAHSHGMLPTNPSFGLKAPRDKTAQAEKVKYLPLMTLKALFAATETARDPAQQVRDKAILALMAIHGLRVCEVSRLDLADVDLEAGEAGELAVLGKGSKRRKVLLTEDTRLCVEKWLAVRRLMRPATAAPATALCSAQDAGDCAGDCVSDCARNQGQPTDALFLALSGGASKAGGAERIGTRGLRAMTDHYLSKIGAKKEGVSCHALRHTYATQSLAAGASLLAISGSLGHSSVTTTQVYAQIVDKARNNPAKFLVGVL